MLRATDRRPDSAQIVTSTASLVRYVQRITESSPLCSAHPSCTTGQFSVVAAALIASLLTVGFQTPAQRGSSR